MTALNLLIAGQSFAGFLVTDPVAKAALKEAFNRFDLDLTVYSSTYDGSSILKANAPAAHPTWYWWNEDTDSAGPLLTSTMAYIGTIPVASRPRRVLWLQGEGDSVRPNPDPDLFKAGTTSVLNAIKAALGVNAGFFAQPAGRRIASGPVPGVQIIREAQLDLIAAGLYVYACDFYDLVYLGDDVMIAGDSGNSHPISPARAVMGWRAAQRILQSQLVATHRMPPQVGTITRSGNDILVPISSGWSTGSVVKPASPAHLAIRDIAGVIESSDLSFAWSGNTLRITPPRAFDAGHFLAPYGEMIAIDRANLIRDALYGTPLRSTKAAIP